MKRVARFVVVASLLVVGAGCASPPARPAPQEATAGQSPAVAPATPPVAGARTEGPSAAAERPVAGEPATGADPDPAPTRDSASVPEKGLASWYGQRFHGRRTASGERYDRNALTAAHRTLPFGTRVRVRAVATGREVVVRINDRGPFKRSRVIDLSQTAFKALGLQGRGVAQVELLPE